MTVQGDVRRLQVKPGDRVLVTFSDRLDRNAVQTVKEQIQTLFPRNEVVVLCGGTMAVLPAGGDLAI